MGWIETKAAGLEIYQCRELNDHQAIQAFSSRQTGNLALHTGDAPQRVVNRRRLWLEALGLSLDRLVSGIQVHGTNIAMIEETDAGAGAWEIDGAIRETDALITKSAGIILATFTADCLPIFIYDPVTPAVAVVHAGWRGALGGIAALTIKRMNQEYGTDPGNCRVGIGPSICGDCFRVGPELAERFGAIHPQTAFGDETASKVDLQAFIRLELQEMGVKPDHIYDSGLCTACRPDRFFSYRAESGETGRMMGIISLKKRRTE